jgi:hypothetical protein
VTAQEAINVVAQNEVRMESWIPEEAEAVSRSNGATRFGLVC